MEFIQEWSLILIALLGIGILAGILAGLLGVGGGIVIVPVLYLVFQAIGVDPATAMLVATGTSLMTIIPTSMSSASAHHKRGNVDFSLLLRWLPGMLLGVLLGSWIVTRVSGLILTAIFGVIGILVALNMLFRASSPPVFSHLPNVHIQRLIGGAIGLFSVMMGIGGGTLGVPTLTSFNVPTHRSVGTAALFGLVIAVPGTLMMLFASHTPVNAPEGTYGLVNVPGFLVIVPLTVLMAPVGVKLGAKLDGTSLKKVFALFLIVVGSRMILQTFQGVL